MKANLILILTTANISGLQMSVTLFLLQFQQIAQPGEV
jgi:hypothetical protein